MSEHIPDCTKIVYYLRWHVETDTVETDCIRISVYESLGDKIRFWNSRPTTNGHTWRYAQDETSLLRLREETQAAKNAIVTT